MGGAGCTVIWEQYIRMGVQVVLGGQVHNSSTHGQPNNSSVQGSARFCVDCEVQVTQCFQMRCVAAWRSPPPAYLPRPLSLPVPPAVSQHLTHLPLVPHLLVPPSLRCIRYCTCLSQSSPFLSITRPLAASLSTSTYSDLPTSTCLTPTICQSSGC